MTGIMSWRCWFNSKGTKEKSVVFLYLLLNVLLSLVSNKVVYVVGGAVFFGTFSLIKNYMNYMVSISTMNAQSSMIYFFPKLSKEEKGSVLFYYTIFAALFSLLIVLCFYLFVKDINGGLVLFATPILVVLQIAKQKLVLDTRYKLLIFFTVFLLMFYVGLWCLGDNEWLKNFSWFLYFLPVTAGLVVFLENDVFSLKTHWNRFLKFIKLSFSSFGPSVLSGFFILKIRELYLIETLKSQVPAIYDMSLGFTSVIFGFVLSFLNLTLLPRFSSTNKDSTKRFLLTGFSCLFIIYVIMYIKAPFILSVLFSNVGDLYVDFARSVLIADFIRIINVVLGLYLFSRGDVFFASVVDAFMWAMVWLVVFLFLERFLFCYQVSLIVLSVIVCVIYGFRVKLVE